MVDLDPVQARRAEAEAQLSRPADDRDSREQIRSLVVAVEGTVVLRTVFDGRSASRQIETTRPRAPDIGSAAFGWAS